MPVFTLLLLMATCLPLTISAAPNKRSNRDLALSNNILRRGELTPDPSRDALYTGTTAPSNIRLSLSNGFPLDSDCHPIPSGEAKGGNGLASISAPAYPTVGAPYQNFTSSNFQPTSMGALVAPSTLASANFPKSNGGFDKAHTASESQCPPQQTITMTLSTVTLSPQILTVTEVPETVTVTPPTQTQTVTITVTPNIQTITVTIADAVTAWKTMDCPNPGITSSPQVPSFTAPDLSLSYTSSTTGVEASTSGLVLEAVKFSSLSTAPNLKTSTPSLEPPVITFPSTVAPLSTVAVIPPARIPLPTISYTPRLSASTALPSIPILALASTTFVTESGPFSTIYEQTPITPISLNSGGALTEIRVINSIGVTTSSRALIPPCLNTTFRSNQTGPFGSSFSGRPKPTISGSLSPTRGPTIHLPYLQPNSSSIQIPPTRSNSSVMSTAGSKSHITPSSFNSSQTLPAPAVSNTTVFPPLPQTKSSATAPALSSNPVPSPLSPSNTTNPLPYNITIPQAPQPPTAPTTQTPPMSAYPLCSPNHTTPQKITTNVRLHHPLTLKRQPANPTQISSSPPSPP